MRRLKILGIILVLILLGTITVAPLLFLFCGSLMGEPEILDSFSPDSVLPDSVQPPSSANAINGEAVITITICTEMTDNTKIAATVGLFTLIIPSLIKDRRITTIDIVNLTQKLKSSTNQSIALRMEHKINPILIPNSLS